MAISFPTSLDTLQNPTSTDALDGSGVLHDVQHADLNDAVEALQAKVGINNSTVQTSLDWKVNHGVAPASSVSYSASLTIDMDGTPWQIVTTMTGNITLATSNRGSSTSVKTVNVILDPGASNRTVSFATGVRLLGYSNPPAAITLLANKLATVTLISPGSNESDTIASYGATS